MDVRDALVQRMRDKMMRMRTALEGFDDESAEREMVGPDWNVRDLVGHMIYWTGEGDDQSPALARGDKPKNYDIDKTNAEVYRKNRRMSFVMLLPQLRAVEERFLSSLGRVDSSALIGETPIREWVDTHLAHYDHHWSALKPIAAKM